MPKFEFCASGGISLNGDFKLGSSAERLTG